MKRHIVSAIAAFLCLTATAQNISPRDNVLWDMNYYNPAMVTRDRGVYADFYGRYEINEIKNLGVNPLNIAAETYVVRDNHAWQATLSHSGLSYFDATSLDLSYSHGFDFGTDGIHSLRIGGRFTIGYGRIDFTKLDYNIIGYKIMVRPDIDLGIDYRYKFFHTGISVKNIMSLPLKENGVTYFRYPRSVMWHILFDVNILDRVMLNPYFRLGMNQNISLDLGMGITFWKYYRLHYCFHGPELSHNFGLSVDIANRVRLEGGYNFSPAHKTGAVTLRLGVRLAD